MQLFLRHTKYFCFGIFVIGLLIVTCLVGIQSCDKKTNDIIPVNESIIGDTSVVTSEKFLSVDYIELDKCERISKFRSGIGHDYSDDFEQCRSMKHYFQPKSNIDWSAVKIFSPVKGTVIRIFDEWAGTQVQIQSSEKPLYTIIIFHIALLKPLAVGDSVFAGQQLGTHIGSQTMSDIAINFSIQNKRKLISYFDVLVDSVFQRYASRGVAVRSDCIISKVARDADSLKCNGDSFNTAGAIENWIVLK